MNHLSIAFRLAWRDVISHKWRSLFTGALFSVPIIAIMTFATLAYNDDGTIDNSPPAATAYIENSRCDDGINHYYCIPSNEYEDVIQLTDRQRISKTLGDNDQLANSFYPEFRFNAEVKGKSGTRSVAEIKSSQAQTRKENAAVPEPGTIILDEQIRQMTNTTIGDQITLKFQDTKKNLTVKEFASNTTIHPEDIPFNTPKAEDIVTADLPTYTTVTWTSSNSIEQDPSNTGVSITRHAALQDEPTSIVLDYFSNIYSAEEFIAWFALWFLVLVFIACIVGPVFAVSANRKLKTLGLLSTIGAKPSDFRNIMLAEGIIIGVCSSIFGIFASITMSLWAFQQSGDIGTIRWPWDVTLLVVVFAIICGIFSALVPALRAQQLNPVTALAGGTSIHMRRLRLHHVIAPIITLLAGIGIATEAFLPFPIWLIIAVISGIISTTTLVLLFGKTSHYLPLSLRLAARDAVRNYHRTVPAIAAITGATMFAFGFVSFATEDPSAESSTAFNNAVSVQTFTNSIDAAPYDSYIHSLQRQLNTPERVNVYRPYTEDTYEIKFLSVRLPSGDQTEESRFPNSASYEALLENHRYPEHGSIIIVDPNAPKFLAAIRPDLFSAETANAASKSLGEGKIVVNHPAILRDGKVKILEGSGNYHDLLNGPPPQSDVKEVPGHVFTSTENLPESYIGLMSVDTARSLGYVPVFESAKLWREQEFQWIENFIIDNAIDQWIIPNTDSPSTYLQRVASTSNPFNFMYLFIPPVIMSVLLTMFVVFLVVILAGIEAERDTKTMLALGADPKLLRKYGGGQGLILGTLGTLAGLFYYSFLSFTTDLHSSNTLDFSEVPWLYCVLLCGVLILLSWVIGLIFGARLKQT